MMIDNIKNWSDAIFASPKILCASAPNYSDKITIKNEIWSLVLDVKIKPNSFTKHNEFAVIQVIPSHVKHYDSKNDNIFRIASEDDIVVVAITFLLYSFTNITLYAKFTSEKYKKTDFFDENLKINYEDILLFNQEYS